MPDSCERLSFFSVLLHHHLCLHFAGSKERTAHVLSVEAYIRSSPLCNPTLHALTCGHCLDLLNIVPTIAPQYLEMEPHVEVALQTSPNGEQDDSQIEDLLSSFYFDNSVKRQTTEEGPSFSTGEHLHPIYEEQEDGMFYDLYGAFEEEERPCYASESSDDETSEASSHYGPKEVLPNIERNPSSFWPLIEEDDDEARDVELSSQTPDLDIILGEDVKDEVEEEEEGRHRGRSRGVPARLARWAQSRKIRAHEFTQECHDHGGDMKEKD
ncbi:hypothetical protein FB446DRAFT_383381 [Lentinula raphanica]|nr:hypothetical protein FB446DRAFT_383381 [Lentinula raphanica]